MIQYLRKADVDDVEHVAAHIRTEDAEEVGALGFSPLDALLLSFDRSDIAYTLLEPSGTPCAIVGVSPSPYGDPWGLIWLLGTSGIERVPMTFLRHSRAALDLLYAESGKTVLYNYSYAKNSLHHRWLKWLGFKFLRKVNLGPDRAEFIEFAQIRN